jgi:predicted DNA binding CopG/RHH family protein
LIAVDKRKSDVFDYAPLTQDVEKAAESKAVKAAAKIAAAKKRRMKPRISLLKTRH